MGVGEPNHSAPAAAPGSGGEVTALYVPDGHGGDRHDRDSGARLNHQAPSSRKADLLAQGRSSHGDDAPLRPPNRRAADPGPLESDHACARDLLSGSPRLA